MLKEIEVLTEAMEIVREARLQVFCETQKTDSPVWQKVNRIWLRIAERYETLAVQILD